MDNLKEKYKALFCEGQNNSDYAGRIFDSLFNYFRAFYIANFEVKILITRKSYMIFKIFEEVFEKIESIKGKKYGEFYTSNYVYQLKHIPNLNEKKILVVDDIVIHGRTISNTCRRLYKIIFNQEVEQIDFTNSKLFEKLKDKVYISSFLVSEEGQCLDAIIPLFVNFNRQVKVNDIGWRDISDKINLFIAKANKGYVSYLDTFCFKKNEMAYNIICSKLDKFEKQDNVLFSDNGIDSYILNLSQCKDFHNDIYNEFISLLDNNRIISFIRVYKYKSSLCIIPFAFLPTVKKDELYEFYLYLLSLNILSTKARENLDNYFSFDSLENNDYVFCFEWITYFLSKCIGIIYFESSGINVDLNSGGIKCSESFSSCYLDNSLLSFSNIKKENKVVFQTAFNNKRKELELDECIRQYELCWDECDRNLNKTMAIYLTRTREIDQCRAKMHMQRLFGICAEDIQAITGLDNSSICTSVINTWDCGMGSGKPKIIETSRDYLGTVTVNGEQIYRYFFDLYKQATYNIRFFIFNCILADYEKISKFAGFIDSKLGDTSHSKLVSYINRDNYSDFINAISQDDIVNYRDVNNSNFKLILTYIKDNNL